MTLARTLTKEEFEGYRSRAHKGPREGSPQLEAFRRLSPGDYVLLSHKGIACNSTCCGIRTIALRLTRDTRLQSVGAHTNGMGSDVAISCTSKGDTMIWKEEEKL